eukprot:12198896-Ditylum_brightwellii.AAC.1
MTEKENIKTSPNSVMRDITVWENITRENKARSAHAPYHGAAEALAGPVCQGCQKVDQKAPPNRQRGQGSQRVHQRQDQRDDQRVQP